MPEALSVTILLLGVGTIVGFVVGRHTGAASARIRELEARTEGLTKERELTRAELEAAREDLARTREELGDYRGRVSEHFSKSFTLLRALSLQYRSDCEQLADGADGSGADEALDIGEDGEPQPLLESVSERRDESSESRVDASPGVSP
ncbi:MAG: hypothetical protein V3T01_03005 [Myxococcota bacterium]|jgi:uncharacterized membrane-anchored protein YhcB (DUF1043 family)